MIVKILKSLQIGHLNILSHPDEQNANEVFADQSALCGQYYQRHVRDHEPYEKLQKKRKKGSIILIKLFIFAQILF